MADQQDPGANIPDPAEISRQMSEIAERSQRLVSGFLERRAQGGHVGMADPMNVGAAFLEMTTRMMADPARMVEAQVNLWQDYMTLWQSAAARMMGEEGEPVVRPGAGDRRFKDAAWDDNALFDYIKQSYLLTARWMQSTVSEVEGLDDKTQRKVDFYTRQFIDAMAPGNFALTNPEVLRATAESGGQNLVDGLDNLLSDLERGEGRLAIRMTDESAFEIGENIAVTPGKVVWRNQLMELIQYEPSTKQVACKPLLIVPPWINKFYILDLREKNSFVRWARDQGFTVFIVSWVNPDEKLAMKSFEDYMFEGPLAALDVIERATGERSVNVIGYCLGGTLLAATLAWMEAKQDDRINTATFFVSMTDFAEAGELSVFIDEEQLASLEGSMRETGYLEGSRMATTFNMLRANDLIWSFVINNYLLGKDPFPFDLLYWNSDSTRMPAEMHSYYLRNMYQKNLLREPGGLTIGGVPIDLRKIAIPAFLLSTREDHIAPWKSTYAATGLFSGEVTFCLAASGHIAGVVNPPDSGKYDHWTNSANPPTPDEWFAGAEEHEGSWWPRWRDWIAGHGDGRVPARVPGDTGLVLLGDAPGEYVTVRSDQPLPPLAMSDPATLKAKPAARGKPVAGKPATAKKTARKPAARKKPAAAKKPAARGKPATAKKPAARGKPARR